MDNGASSYRRFRDNGDKSGLAEVIREYKDGLIFYIASIVGDIHTAEDIAEDTFVLLGTKKPRNKGIASFRTWLYTIGRNLAIDHIRRKKRHNEVSLEHFPESTDEEYDLELSYLREERKVALRRAMKSLKAEYRQVLWLIYFEGLSCRETAQIMDKSVHNTETLVYRARLALKAQLEKEGFEYEDL